MTPETEEWIELHPTDFDRGAQVELVIDVINAEIDGANIGGAKIKKAVHDALRLIETVQEKQRTAAGLVQVKIQPGTTHERLDAVLAARAQGLIVINPDDPDVREVIRLAIARAALPHGISGVTWQRRFEKWSGKIIEALRVAR